MRHVIFSMIVAFLYASAAFAGESRSLTSDESDMLIYLKSVSAPPMKNMCVPITKNMPQFEANYSAWLSQNQEAIQRGRQARIAILNDGQTIESYEAGMQSNLNKLLTNTPVERIAFQCLGFIASVSPKKTEVKPN